MLPNGLGQLAEGAEATARCPAAPPVKFSFGNLALRAGINSLERLTQTHCSAKFGVLATEIFTLLLTLLAQVPSVAAQAPERTFEILTSITPKLTAYLVECLAGQHHEVELVEDDPGLRKMLRRALDIGWAHIHGNRLDLGGIAAVLAQRLGEGSKGFCTASLHHEEQT